MNNLVGVHCHICNKNTDAKDTAPFISLPSTLIVCVRFAYNQRTKQASKLNDKLEVSSKLTIETTMVSLVGMLMCLYWFVFRILRRAISCILLLFIVAHLIQAIILLMEILAKILGIALMMNL